MPIKVDKRMKLLRSIVSFSDSIANLSSELQQFPFDFSGKPFQLRKQDVLQALNFVISGKISLSEIELWAETLEVREDVEIVGKDNDEIEEISDSLFLLATPSLSEIKGRALIDSLMLRLNT
jgi:hypothetical protein